MAWLRNLTGPLTLLQAHKVVAVAMTTAKPEVHTLGGDDVVVVAGHPSAAGASGARQGANRALNCRQETEINPNVIVVPLVVIFFSLLQSSYCDWVGWGSPRRWVLTQVWCGHNSIRRWWFGTRRRSQSEEKKQPGPTWHDRQNIVIVVSHTAQMTIICQSGQD